MKKRYVLVDTINFEAVDPEKVLYQSGHKFHALFDTGVTYVPEKIETNIDEYVPDVVWGNVEDLYKAAKNNMRKDGYLFFEEDVILVVR